MTGAPGKASDKKRGTGAARGAAAKKKEKAECARPGLPYRRHCVAFCGTAFCGGIFPEHPDGKEHLPACICGSNPA